jgi:hypothetical protein
MFHAHRQCLVQIPDAAAGSRPPPLAVFAPIDPAFTGASPYITYANKSVASILQAHVATAAVPSSAVTNATARLATLK